jgi:predicted extracellular nuclease
VENLDPSDGPTKFDALAKLIVNNLRSPDLIALEEVQDNNGPINDSVVDASQTFNLLIAAIQANGGPTYQYRSINPIDDRDGGEPGGNIRVGFLYHEENGLKFVDRPGGDATTPVQVLSDYNAKKGEHKHVQLSISPGRIDPTNDAFLNSRKPLAGEFKFRGNTLFVVANHFNSKGGDQPLFGRFQPPARSSETQRQQQAQIVNTFVDSILARDPNANIIVLGDINDFQFSSVMETLKGGVLYNLIDTLPISQQYSYVFEGNSQALDHILVSENLFSRPFSYDIVHVNAEFADQISDHDPQVARFELTGRGKSK